MKKARSHDLTYRISQFLYKFFRFLRFLIKLSVVYLILFCLWKTDAIEDITAIVLAIFSPFVIIIEKNYYRTGEFTPVKKIY